MTNISFARDVVPLCGGYPKTIFPVTAVFKNSISKYYILYKIKGCKQYPKKFQIQKPDTNFFLIEQVYKF